MKHKFQIPQEEMNKLGFILVRTIREDALKGIMQNNTQGHQYKSQRYKLYKANNMRRLTISRKGKTRLRAVKIGFTQQGVVSKNQRLKGYESVSLNNNVQFVNLHLTSAMFKSLGVIHSDTNFLRIGYSEEQRNKVLGNKARGYDVVGLNKKNYKLASDFIYSRVKRIANINFKGFTISIK